MTRADQVAEPAEDRLEAIVRTPQKSGGVKAKAESALAEDPSFLRKLKPSLVAARVRGENPPAPGAPSGSRLDGPDSTLQKQPKKSGGSVRPWLRGGGGLPAGFVVAKGVDLGGGAHPPRGG